MNKTVEFVFKGRIMLSEDHEKSFTQDFENLIKTHNAIYDGVIRSYKFDECEIIEDEENTN